MRAALMGVLALCVAGSGSGFAAESYPAKSVRVIAPYSPGGATDFIARVISQQLSEQLGQPFVVENRVGAGGTIGNALVAKAAPDGYTLMLADPSFAIAPSLYKSLPYDVTRDFTPIVEIIEVPQALVVHPSLNVTTLKEFIELAKRSDGKLNYGSAGVGGTIHLSSELFKNATKLDIQHVPYSGGGGAMMAGLLGGQVQMVVAAIPTLYPYVKGGQLRALAATTAEGKRAAALPDVPSMNESGVPGMVVYLWFGLVGPARMPREIVDMLQAEVRKALMVPKVREQLLAQGDLVGGTPEEFSALIRSELRRWSEVTATAGIRSE